MAQRSQQQEATSSSIDGGDNFAKDLFSRLDINSDGALDAEEIKTALKKLNLPYTDSYVRDVIVHLDTNKDGKVSYDEFRVYVVNKYKQLYQLFAEFDTNRDGVIDTEEIESMLERLDMPHEKDQIAKLVKLLDKDSSGKIDFEEWVELLSLVPISNIQSLLEYWKEAAVFDLEDGVPPPPTKSRGAQAFIHLSAGAIAGAASRTGTAPLERLKILYQIQTTKPPSVIQGLASIYKTEGLRGLWKGNGVNVLKIAPESAVKFLTFEAVKRFFGETDGELSSYQLFVSGASAGVAAHAAFFPLEVIKTRISASKTNISIAKLVSDIAREEGRIRPFYRGLSVSLASTIPHSGFNLAAYETTKRFFVGDSPDSEPGMVALMAAGGISSTVSQLVFYPMHTIKARLIMQNHGDVATRQYNGAIDVVRKTVQNEGTMALYKGFTPSFLKSVPAHIITYVTYETLKKAFGITKKHKHGHH